MAVALLPSRLDLWAHLPGCHNARFRRGLRGGSTCAVRGYGLTLIPFHCLIEGSEKRLASFSAQGPIRCS